MVRMINLLLILNDGRSQISKFGINFLSVFVPRNVCIFLSIKFRGSLRK